MKIGVGRRALAVAAFGVLTAFPASQADAMSDREEIQALLSRVKKLEAKVAKQDKEEKTARRSGQPHPGDNSIVTKSADGAPIYPDRFYYRGITIKPGGFFEFAALYRNRFMGADIATPFQNIPYNNNVASYGTEYRFSPRRSRFTMQVDGDIDPVSHIGMYLATDFLGAGQTANLNQSDSWNFRFRELYAQYDRSDLGLHVMAGQAYTLISLNSRGTLANTFLTPPVIDDQYMPGYTWARQPGIRVTKELPYNLQFALAAENSATTFILPGADFAGRVAPCVANAGVGIGGTGGIAGSGCAGGAFQGAFNVGPVGGSLYNALNLVTTTRLPDLIAKASWDPTFFDRTIHFEVGGLLRDFSDRVYWGNHAVWGGNVEAGVVVPIIPKLLDFQFSGIAGNGNGRLGAAQINDATFSPTGAVQPIHERQAMIGVIAHVTPQTDVYAFAGGEFASPNYTVAGFPKGSPVITPGFYAYGYGNPAYNNIGCNFEPTPGLTTFAGAPLACVGQIKDVRQVTGGIWHDFYNGPFGKLRAGAQYSYTVKDSFQGVGGAYKATESMVFTSLRYYPF
jgi:hypothetical protein